MSDLKLYKVNTKHKRSLKRPGAPDLAHNQIVRYKPSVASKTPWIKAYVDQGFLVEVNEAGKAKSAPKVEKPAPAKEEVKVEVKPEPVAETPKEEVEVPKEVSGEGASSPSEEVVETKPKKKKKSKKESSDNTESNDSNNES